ncbi:MAG: ParA family protein [Candidatus Dadabacteria bacterium]|nr:MAG: ParA family protein [Candidatus Dadabacteria bacterium]
MTDSKQAAVIGILNQKGGVGKTTTTVNLGAGLSSAGKRVLLIDIDPQSNLTTHLGLDNVPREAAKGQERDESQREESWSASQDVVEDSFYAGSTIYEVLKGEASLLDVIVHKEDSALDVVPSSLLLSAADLEFGGRVGRELMLRRALEPVIERYDFILIDCPPALGLLTLNVLAAVTQVIIPVQSEYLALHGVRQLLDTIDQVRSIYNPELRVGGVLICMHDKRRKLAKAVADTIRSYFGDLVFNTVIRSNVSLAEAPSQGKDVISYAPSSSGAMDYKALTEEFLKRIG